MTSQAPRFSRRRFIALLAAALPAFAWAAYPDRPIRLICPFPPGSGSDFVVRMIAARMQESLKQTVLVENRTGAAATWISELFSPWIRVFIDCYASWWIGTGTSQAPRR